MFDNALETSMLQFTGCVSKQALRAPEVNAQVDSKFILVKTGVASSEETDGEAEFADFDESEDVEYIDRAKKKLIRNGQTAQLNLRSHTGRSSTASTTAAPVMRRCPGSIYALKLGDESERETNGSIVDKRWRRRTAPLGVQAIYEAEETEKEEECGKEAVDISANNSLSQCPMRSADVAYVRDCFGYGLFCPQSAALLFDRDDRGARKIQE
ncbi:hypothetical protein CONLIGDRAFT_687651 [Coniochaeta ligniaria NRRL 30616]|uniref:Uncharacterized protein n=1 Tax=Coniochaeta ligniaria NRRL 30616 TaxID=1408157 RepID=A0A1J7IMJ8_9PEZI|nr:hypothetical protein CONLIGDRAFT_687651 [Coniochaeta ligniaria NRRL 30616]